MSSEYPATLEDFLAWAQQTGIPGFARREEEKNYYENVTRVLAAELRLSEFWSQLVTALRDAHAEREISSQYGGLLAHSVDELEVLVKPWESVLQKCHRKNVLDRPDEFPAPPPGGWIGPENVLDQLNDLLRTTVTTKFMDGTEDVRKIVEQVASACGVTFEPQLEARDEGYYALHIVAKVELPCDTREWQRELRPVRFEIQVCTQIQEVIRSLTHKLYEETRCLPKQDRAEWQWDSSSPLFTPSYVGHMLHYADGVILNARRDRELSREP